MGLLSQVTNWFRRSDKVANGPEAAEKSMSPLPRQLRTALGGGAVGNAITNHMEETRHMESFSYVAIHALGMQLHSASVEVYADGDRSHLASQRKSCRAQFGRNWRSAYKSSYGAEESGLALVSSDHDLMRLMRRPNPYEPGGMFRYRQVIQLRLTGVCYVWNVPNAYDGNTCQRYVIPTSAITPVYPCAGLPFGGYRITPNCSKWGAIPNGFEDEFNGYNYFQSTPALMAVSGLVIDAREVQKCGYPSPVYLDEFLSPMQAGSQWVDAERSINTARTAGVSRELDPSLLIELPEGSKDVDQDEMDLIQRKYEAKFGGAANARKPIVSVAGTKVTMLGSTPKDMAYADGYKDTKEAVLALHNTPPVAIGIQEAGAYAAYIASQRQYTHTAVAPVCDMLAESDTFHLAPQFGNGLTVELVPITVNDEQETNARVSTMGSLKNVIKVNEVRSLYGMEQLDDEEGEAFAGADQSQGGEGVPGAFGGMGGADPRQQPGSGGFEGVRKPISPFARDAEPEPRSKAYLAAVQGIREADDEAVAKSLKEIVRAEIDMRVINPRVSYKARWITINSDGEGGGTPIKIDEDGTILAGPSSLAEQGIRHISHFGKDRDSEADQDAETEKQVAEMVPHAHQYLIEQHSQWEVAKQNARRITGLTAGDVARLENSYRDHSSVDGFDAASRTVAMENPELGLDPDAHDTPERVWELIREGAKRKPSKNSQEVRKLAEEWARSSPRGEQQDHHSGSGGWDEWDDWKSMKRKFATTQIDLPDDLASRVIALSQTIPDEFLADDGRESEPHLTIKYGIHANDPKPVAAAVAGFGEVRATLGEVSWFTCDGFDVLKFDVVSPQAIVLNGVIADKCQNTTSFPYSPHVTIAYVRSGMGQRFAEIMRGCDLVGAEITAKTITFSASDRKRTRISLLNRMKADGWVTMNNTPVKISDGEVVAGPPNLTNPEKKPSQEAKEPDAKLIDRKPSSLTPEQRRERAGLLSAEADTLSKAAKKKDLNPEQAFAAHLEAAVMNERASMATGKYDDPDSIKASSRHWNRALRHREQAMKIKLQLKKSQDGEGEKSLGMSLDSGAEGGFSAKNEQPEKPTECNCDFPDVMARSGSGHRLDCPCHQAWVAQKSFDESKHPRGGQDNPGQFAPKNSGESIESREQSDSGTRRKIGSGSSGDVFRVGDRVEKRSSKAEAEAYQALSGVHGVADGKIDGDAISTPFFSRIISVDEIPVGEREKYAETIRGQAATIVNAVTALSQKGMEYNDPLQIGLDDDGNANLFDFSMVSESDPDSAMRSNSALLEGFLMTFGLKDDGRAVGRAGELLQYVNDEDTRAFDSDSWAGQQAEKIATQLNGAAKFAYYTFDSQDIPGVPQTDHSDGSKIVVTSEPLDPAFMEKWGLNPAIHRTDTTAGKAESDRGDEAKPNPVADHLQKAIADGLSIKLPKRPDMSAVDLADESPEGAIRTKMKLADGTDFDCTVFFRIDGGKAVATSVDSDAVGPSKEFDAELRKAGIDSESPESTEHFDMLNQALESDLEKVMTPDMQSRIRDGISREIEGRRKRKELGDVSESIRRFIDDPGK